MLRFPEMKDGSASSLKSPGATLNETFENKPPPKSHPAHSSENCYVLKNKNGVHIAIAYNNTRIIKLLMPDGTGSTVNLISGNCISGTLAENEMNAQHGDDNLFFSDGVFGCLDIEQAQFIAYPENKVYQIEWTVARPSSHELSFACNMEVGCADDLCIIKINIHYFLSAYNVISVVYGISADKKIICNSPAALLFNLNGVDSGSILRHQVCINAGKFVCINPFLLAAGEIKDVMGTPFDFRKSATIGSRIFDNDLQLKNGDGYNHSFILNRHSHKTTIARVKGDKTGIILEVYTEQPFLKFYTCNCMVKNANIPSHQIFHKYSSFAFKAGSLSDPGNIIQPQPVVLFPGDIYKIPIKYRIARY